MSRNKFIGLIVMMLLSITGIILVQYIWIRNAVGIRNEEFNAAVAVSLRNAAKELESSRELEFFNNFLMSDPGFLSNQGGDITGYLSIQRYSSPDSENINININDHSFSARIDSGRTIYFRNNSSGRKDSVEAAGSGSFTINSSNIYGESPGQEYAGNQLTDSGSADIKQSEFIKWLKKRSDDFRNISDQMIAEMFRWEKTREINKAEVGYVLQQSLLLSGIQTPFEFAIIKNGNVVDEYKRKSDKRDFVKSLYKIRLFPDNLIRQDLVLSVVFPERTNYVLGYITWIFIGSMGFSLFILSTFAFSLYFIVRQKKITEMKADFINNMTHEFKTPIATISLAADTITNPKVIRDESKVKHFISMIKKENSRMNKQVETILQIASLDKKEIEFSFRDVSIHSIIERAVDTIEIQVQQKHGVIRLNLNAKDPDIVGDEEHLTNLVHNLLDNAIKYSNGSPEIIISTSDDTKGIKMSVEDNGIGMSKSVQSRIFERFYRQSSGNIHDVKGFGLGLNYVRAIIGAHHGDITVTSEPGKGSRFDIFLPFNRENLL
jgi:two-component system phosphate regulon sensor histidine kinase PhoR